MRRSLLPALIVLTMAPLAACDNSSSDTASTSTSTTTKAAVPTIADSPTPSITSTTSSSSPTVAVPPELTDTEQQAIQDALGSTTTLSAVGRLGANDGTGVSTPTGAMGLRTVRVVCAYGTGKLKVTIVPDRSKTATHVREMACPGANSLVTRDIYVGRFAADQMITIDHRGSGNVGYGVAVRGN